MMDKGSSWSIWRRKPNTSLTRKTKFNQMNYFIMVCFWKHFSCINLLEMCMGSEVSIIHSAEACVAFFYCITY